MKRSWAGGISLFCWLLFLGGCASVPPETVKLSSSVGDQIAAIEKSHKTYINRAFDVLEANANRLIDEAYTPKLISAGLNGRSGQMLMNALTEAKTNPNTEATARALAYTEEFLKLVKVEVDSQRNQLLNPIRQNRSAALANVDAAYEQVLRGNATVTAYLASIVKIRETQDQMFSAAGAPGLQDEIASAAAKASDDIEALTQKAKAGDQKLDDVKTAVQKILSTLNRKGN
jgi:hypothetical protein